MLLYVCFILGTWKSVMGKPTMCNEPNFKVCNTIRDLSFPKTEADLDQMCPKMIKHLDCLQCYSDKCGSDSNKDWLLPGMKNLAEDGCRKDSSFHLRIVQTIGCFHDEIRNEVEACSRYRSEKSLKIREYILNLETTYDHELWTPFQCLAESLEMSCLASKTAEKCGPGAEDVYLEVVRRAGFSRRYCANSSEVDLSKLLKPLELESQEETSLNRFIRREQ